MKPFMKTQFNNRDVISSLFGVFILLRLFKILYLMYLKLDYKTCAEMPHVKHSKYLFIQKYKFKNHL
jgi:hypothetical protein